MWTCITIVYLVPAALLTIRMIGPQPAIAPPGLGSTAVPQTEPQEMEVSCG